MTSDSDHLVSSESPQWRCLLLSGGIGAGKTTIARLIAQLFGMEVIVVRSALVEALGLREADRRLLQQEGAALDRRTRGSWLADFIVARLETANLVVVDAVRTEVQTIPILRRVPNTKLVYLEADVRTREARFHRAAGQDKVKRSMSFREAITHPTEQNVVRLRALADLVVETDALTPEATVREIVSGL